MTSIAHGLTGAFIATKLPSPFLYVPVIFASHYLEDWIPHWDVGTGLSSGKRKRSTAIILELFDLAITFGLVYLFWGYGQSDLSVFWLACIGAFVGLLPDFMEAPRNFLKWEPAFLKPFNEFHGMFHHSTPNKIVGILPQVVVIAVIWWLK
ncbi:MAG: hypothetical protein JNK33_05910 [Candidatus Doudnabacteria bacterium]|nr:hypothetical protein [Candidatus Doudnabacteria bacterium]